MARECLKVEDCCDVMNSISAELPKTNLVNCRSLLDVHLGLDGLLIFYFFLSITSTMSHHSHARSLYRRLLRELPPLPHPRHRSPRTPIHNSIRQHFSQPISNSSSEYALARRQETEQFLTYLRAQRIYGILLHRYNPGMWMDEEERVRLSARRVGMNMPVEYNWKMKP